jgi:hypothetical protein
VFSLIVWQKLAKVTIWIPCSLFIFLHRPQLNPQLDPQLSPQLNPQLNPQLSPQLNPQLNTEQTTNQRLLVKRNIYFLQEDKIIIIVPIYSLYYSCYASYCIALVMEEINYLYLYLYL